ncbi:hypothetical protein MUP35_04840 [Patescibacteria group bacterium]|nr:hypothetical protein [Patescibacteria group bacterium]
MSPKNIDFNEYIEKHCARYYGWLPASIAYKKEIKEKPLKYFTLCAKAAIDVFMLEKEGVLKRDQNKKLPNVIICESEEKDAVEIFNLVRPPLEKAIIVGKLEEILTFQDTDKTKGLSLDQDPKDAEIRRLLRIKRLSKRIKEYFPFDIINFDPWESLVSLNFEKNKMYKAFQRIFELQKPVDSFLLFVTSEITEIHSNVQSRFKRDLESNISRYPQIGETLLSLVNATTYDMIEDNKRVALAFAKSVVMSLAKSKGWNCEHKGIYIYEKGRAGGTRMLSSVVKFSKAHTTPDETTYVQDLIQIIKSMPKYYSYYEASRNKEVKDHLEEVKKYREKIRDEYREES